MTSLTFPDANVWLALAWAGHVHSDAAWHWFRSSAESPVGYCRSTQISTLRLLTTKAVLGDDFRTMSQAWNIWDSVCTNPRVQFLTEPAGIVTAFRHRSTLKTASPKVWADAYILAFADAAGAELVTFDRALRRRIPRVRVLC